MELDTITIEEQIVANSSLINGLHKYILEIEDRQRDLFAIMDERISREKFHALQV